MSAATHSLEAWRRFRERKERPHEPHVSASPKGGEADVVYLFPDLSGEADRQYQKTGPPRDAVIRQFYVGMTRARETLYICPMETGMAVRL